MGVSLDKVEKEAPHLVSLVKQVKINLEKNNFDPEANKAAVVATIDKSGSTEQLFNSGEIQRVADLAFAAGLVFDDDGDVPLSFFDNQISGTGSIDLKNCHQYVKKSGVRAGGGTSYIAALNWIVSEAGFSNVNLSTTQERRGGGLFRKSSATLTEAPQSVKATAAYPTFAIFITDGAPGDDHQEIIQLVHDMSQLPIFVQFIGVGPYDFEFLKQLDDMEGRFVDNVNFFDAKNASNEEGMLKGLLNEFSTKYYPAARAKGLLR